MPDLSELVRPEDPAWYGEELWTTVARLQEEAPVFWYEPLDLFLLTRFEDIRAVGRDPGNFSSANGLTLNDFRYGNILESFLPPGAESVQILDPPRHTELRRVLREPLSPRAIKRLEEQIRTVCRDLLDRITPGKPVDWVDAVAVPLPLSLIALHIGFPLEDIDKLKHWSDEFMKFGSHLDAEGFQECAANIAPMPAYLEEHLDRRRREPGDDLLSYLLAAEDQGAINRMTVHSMLVTVLTAGNETARNTLAGGLIALSEHPDQYQALVADPSLAGRATEELLRWVTPVRGFGRTVMADTAVRGQAMTAGQRIFSLYMAANRDPAAFTAPDRFDITLERRNMHLTFGFGEHNCIGAPLARLQIRVLLEELVARFSKVELAGEPAMLADELFANSWTSVPLRLHS